MSRSTQEAVVECDSVSSLKADACALMRGLYDNDLIVTAQCNFFASGSSLSRPRWDETACAQLSWAQRIDPIEIMDIRNETRIHAGISTSGAYGVKTATTFISCKKACLPLGPQSAKRARGGSIFWFGREHLFVPTVQLAAARSARPSPGWPLFRGHPKGLALTGRAPCYDGVRSWRSTPKVEAQQAVVDGKCERTSLARLDSWVHG